VSRLSVDPFDLSQLAEPNVEDPYYTRLKEHRPKFIKGPISLVWALPHDYPAMPPAWYLRFGFGRA
jgi:hypothetical protein